MWDPELYGRFADQRNRPFHELVARIGATAPATVVDLGCGDGDPAFHHCRAGADAKVSLEEGRTVPRTG